MLLSYYVGQAQVSRGDVNGQLTLADVAVVKAEQVALRGSTILAVLWYTLWPMTVLNQFYRTDGESVQLKIKCKDGTTGYRASLSALAKPTNPKRKAYDLTQHAQEASFEETITDHVDDSEAGRGTLSSQSESTAIGCATFWVVSHNLGLVTAAKLEFSN